MIDTKELEQSAKLVGKQNESSWLSSAHFVPIKSVTWPVRRAAQISVSVQQSEALSEGKVN